MKLGAVAGPGGTWPLVDFLGTQYGAANAVRIGSSLVLAWIAHRTAARERSRAASVALVIAAVALAVNAAWLSHAGGRLDRSAVLFVADTMHRASAATWVGGLVQLLAFWLLWRGHRDDALATRVLSRFSRLATVAIAILVGAGFIVSLHYVDSLGSLIGTAFGVMVLSKVVLLAIALLLGATNFGMVRRLDASSIEPPPRVRWLVEAEIGVGITILLAAVSLSSVPPTVDVTTDRVEPTQVATRFHAPDASTDLTAHRGVAGGGDADQPAGRAATTGRVRVVGIQPSHGRPVRARDGGSGTRRAGRLDSGRPSCSRTCSSTVRRC